MVRFLISTNQSFQKKNIYIYICFWQKNRNNNVVQNKAVYKSAPKNGFKCIIYKNSNNAFHKKRILKLSKNQHMQQKNMYKNNNITKIWLCILKYLPL